MSTQENTLEINTGECQPDGENGAFLVRIAIPVASTVAKIAHGLGRVPTKAYVVESIRQPFTCYTIYKDRDQIHLGFIRSDIGFSLDGGTAVVRIA